MRGGARSTAWKPGQSPVKKKGTKNKTTKVKEAIGLTGWERLCEFILNEGSDKLVEEMNKLQGKDFVNSLGALYEFVKPKLNRTTVEGGEKPIIHKLVIEDARDCKPMQ